MHVYVYMCVSITTCVFYVYTRTCRYNSKCTFCTSCVYVHTREHTHTHTCIQFHEHGAKDQGLSFNFVCVSYSYATSANNEFCRSRNVCGL